MKKPYALLRWSAYITGILAISFVLMLFSLLFSSDFEKYKFGIKIITVFVFSGLCAAGYIFSYFKPKIGGLVVMAVSIIQYIFMAIVAGVDGLAVALLFTLPFLITGLLFLIYGKKAENSYRFNISYRGKRFK